MALLQVTISIGLLNGLNVGIARLRSSHAENLTRYLSPQDLRGTGFYPISTRGHMEDWKGYRMDVSLPASAAGWQANMVEDP